MGKLFYNIVEKIYLNMPDNKVFYDTITGTKTRYYYNEVAKSKYKNEEIFVAFLDINSLKKINDEMGHYKGTELIKDVANKLKLLDVLDICRIGGDEFILFANKDFDKTLLNNVKEVSYGYVIKKNTETLEEAVDRADSYMYKRKKKIHKKGR